MSLDQQARLYAHEPFRQRVFVAALAHAMTLASEPLDAAVPGQMERVQLARSVIGQSSAAAPGPGYAAVVAADPQVAAAIADAETVEAMNASVPDALIAQVIQARWDAIANYAPQA